MDPFFSDYKLTQPRTFRLPWPGIATGRSTATSMRGRGGQRQGRVGGRVVAGGGRKDDSEDSGNSFFSSLFQ